MQREWAAASSRASFVFKDQKTALDHEWKLFPSAHDHAVPSLLLVVVIEGTATLGVGTPPEGVDLFEIHDEILIVQLEEPINMPAEVFPLRAHSDFNTWRARTIVNQFDYTGTMEFPQRELPFQVSEITLSKKPMRRDVRRGNTRDVLPDEIHTTLALTQHRRGVASACVILNPALPHQIEHELFVLLILNFKRAGQKLFEMGQKNSRLLPLPKNLSLSRRQWQCEIGCGIGEEDSIPEASDGPCKEQPAGLLFQASLTRSTWGTSPCGQALALRRRISSSWSAVMSSSRIIQSLIPWIVTCIAGRQFGGVAIASPVIFWNSFFDTE